MRRKHPRLHSPRASRITLSALRKKRRTCFLGAHPFGEVPIHVVIDGNMAILKTCCCWKSVRDGSFACGIYTMIFYTIFVTFGTFHLTPAIENKVLFALGLLALCVSGMCVMSSALLLVGLCAKKNSRKSPKERLLPEVEKPEENVEMVPCDSPTKVQMKRRLETLEVKNEESRKKIKLLHQSKRRLKKKVKNLKDIIKSIRKSKLMQDDSIEVLNSVAACNEEFLQRQICKSTSSKLPTKYSPELRSFALTLHYLSPRAYDYVRNTFSLALPHKRTIAKWYEHINGEPGFTHESLKALEQRIAESPTQLLFALMMDEMAIRQHVEFCGKSFHGYVNFGMEENDDILPVANNVLVFLVVCINDNWKLPVGYFLINSLDSCQRSSLVDQCLLLLHGVKAQVVSLTFDGVAANLAMAKKLGCDLKNPSSLKTTFPHPADKQQHVAIFPDVCHMLKLVRNTLGEKKSVVDNEGNMVDWKYVCALEKLQESEGLHIANKLRSSHINFSTQKMKVSLAAQLLSDSVADAIEFCNKNLQFPEFSGSDATVKFVRVFNVLFDVLNSRSLYHEGYKKAVCVGNMDEVIQVLADCKTYILGLKTSRNGPAIIKSQRKTGFLGFLICIESLLHVCGDLISCSTPLLRYLPTYKLSQDHLELLFSIIRYQGGCNNNPTARQFKSAYKKLLVKHELKSSRTGNCLPFGEVAILSVPSTHAPTDVINLTTKHQRAITNEGDDPEHDVVFDLGLLNELSVHVIHYIAGYVAKKLASLLKCHDCICALFATESATVSLIHFKSRGGLVYPSTSLYRLCQLCEAVFRRNPECNFVAAKKCFVLLRKEKEVLEHVLGMKLFPDLDKHALDFNAMDNHVLHLVRAIIKEYLTIRYKYECKKLSSNPKAIRQLYTKLVIFKGQ